MSWTEEVPTLTVSMLETGNVRLEDKSYGDGAVVDLHPCQVRLVAERVGLIDPPDREGQPTVTMHEQARDLDRLKRYLLRVREHALKLQDDFRKNADWDHADLTFEMCQINTLVDLLDMAVDDFSDDYEGRAPWPYAPPSRRLGGKVASGKEGPKVDQGKLL